MAAFKVAWNDQDWRLTLRDYYWQKVPVNGDVQRCLCIASHVLRKAKVISMKAAGVFCSSSGGAYDNILEPGWPRMAMNHRSRLFPHHHWLDLP